MAPVSVLYLLWDAWIVSWIVAAVWSARTIARPEIGPVIFYRTFMIGGGIVLFFYSSPAEPGPSWNVATGLGWTMVVLAAIGLFFTWWARIHLGRFWSGSVARKTDHRIIESGPYRLVRHPIYTGIIFACYASAIAKGTLLALAGASAMFIGCYTKARLEERFLRAELGLRQYDSYAERVPMLVPFARAKA